MLPLLHGLTSFIPNELLAVAWSLAVFAIQALCVDPNRNRSADRVADIQSHKTCRGQNWARIDSQESVLEQEYNPAHGID